MATDPEQQVVWVGGVPGSLCVSEDAVREVFAVHNKRIVSVKIRHDFEDMTTDGFVFITLSSKRSAERLVQDVNDGIISVGSAMQAKLAIDRGAPNLDALLETHSEIADLLLGRRQANALSQQYAGGEEDDEDSLMLQSLSQPSFASQSRKKKRKKRSSQHD